jgi:hypothetical protein
VRREKFLFGLQLAFTASVCAFLIVPVVLSILAGLTVNYLVGLESGLTLRWVIEVWSNYRDTLFLSVGIALACLVITLLLGVPAAYVLARSRNRLGRAIEELLVMPIAVPGLATALALIVTYGGLSGLRTSAAFILLGHVLFTLPFMVRSVLAVLCAIDLETLEEGAASLGAGFFADGGDPVDGRVQHDLAAPHAFQQDAAGRPRRCLRLAAAGGRQRLYADILRDDHPAAARHAGLEALSALLLHQSVDIPLEGRRQRRAIDKESAGRVS